MNTIVVAKNQSPRPHIVSEVCSIVKENFYDKKKLVDWDKKCSFYRKKADAASNHQQVLDLIAEMLGTMDVSHLRVLEPDVFHFDVYCEMNNIKAPSFGFDLFEHEGKIKVRDVLDGSAAYDAGIARGDVLVKINGEPTKSSRLLRPAGTGAGYHIFPEGPVKLFFVRDGNVMEKTVYPKNWNHIDAIERSAHLENFGDDQFGYVHLWHMSNKIVLEILDSLLKGGFRDASGLVLDLRGFGGNIEYPAIVTNMIMSWGKPVVAVTDGNTRSSKEMLAYLLRKNKAAVIVGERTLGAVLGSHFFPLSDGSQIIVPTISCASMTDGVSLEKNGVRPDVYVKDVLGVRDPILEGSARVLRSMTR